MKEIKKEKWEKYLCIYWDKIKFVGINLIDNNYKDKKRKIRAYFSKNRLINYSFKRDSFVIVTWNKDILCDCHFWIGNLW